MLITCRIERKVRLDYIFVSYIFLFLIEEVCVMSLNALLPEIPVLYDIDYFM